MQPIHLSAVSEHQQEGGQPVIQPVSQLVDKAAAAPWDLNHQWHDNPRGSRCNVTIEDVSLPQLADALTAQPVIWFSRPCNSSPPITMASGLVTATAAAADDAWMVEASQLWTRWEQPNQMSQRQQRQPAPGSRHTACLRVTT